MKRWHAVLFLLCLPALSCWKILFGHGEYSFFVTNDAAQHWYPWYQYLARWIHAGILPLWDVHLQSGRPLMGEMRPGVLYPPNLLLLSAFSSKDGISLIRLDLFIVLEVVLASVFQYRLSRYLNLSRYASLLSAILYAYCGYVAENATWQIAIFDAVIWMPLLVLLFLRAYESGTGLKRTVSLLSSGVVFSVMILAGHIQPPVHAVLCLGLLAVYMPLTSAAPRSGGREMIFSAGRLAACLSVGLLVASPQLIVSWEYGQRSLRWLGWDDLAPVNGISRIPYAWGGHFERGHLQDVFTAINPGTWAGSDYFGAASVLLAITAFLLVRGTLVRFFKILLVLGIFLWLGELSVFHGLLYQLVPLMDKVRQPSRAIFLIHFCTATLGGFGAEVLARSIRKREKKGHYQLARLIIWICSFSAMFLLTVGMLAVLFKASSMTDEHMEWTLRAAFLLLVSATALYFRQVGRLRLRHFRILLLLIVAFDLFSVFSNEILSRYGYNGRNDYFPTVHYARNDAIDFLTERARRGLFRVEVVGDALPPNSGMVHGFEEVTGGMATGLEEYQAFLAIDRSLHSAIPRLLNRRYIVSRDALPVFDEVFHGPPRIFEDRSALPRATWIPGAMILDSRESVAGALRRQEFNLRTVVLVTRDQSTAIPPDLRISGHSALPDSAQGEVAVRSYEPDRIVATCASLQAGIVLFSEIAYPGWRASIDGVPVPIVTADYLLRAVVVEKGRHTIELVYRPRFFSAALILCLVAILSPVVLVLVQIVHQSRSDSKDSAQNRDRQGAGQDSPAP